MRPSSYIQRTSGSTQRALRVSVKYTCNATFKHIQRDDNFFGVYSKNGEMTVLKFLGGSIIPITF